MAIMEHLFQHSAGGLLQACIEDYRCWRLMLHELQAWVI